MPSVASTFDDHFFPLDARIDVERLRVEMDRLVEVVPLIFIGTPQLALQSFIGSERPWYDACRKQREIGDDANYTVLNEKLKGSYLEEIFNQLPFTPFRARLMGLECKARYSPHRDATPRYHIALKTTELAHFVFVGQNRAIHIPADGRIYFVDTREEHTAFNDGPSLRLHLVFGGPAMTRAEQARIRPRPTTELPSGTNASVK
jgi:Aspartyl/Asparaginyl beta-hydroxylase